MPGWIALGAGDSAARPDGRTWRLPIRYRVMLLAFQALTPGVSQRAAMVRLLAGTAFFVLGARLGGERPESAGLIPSAGQLLAKGLMLRSVVLLIPAIPAMLDRLLGPWRDSRAGRQIRTS
jgi:hypothetical protein